MKLSAEREVPRDRLANATTLLAGLAIAVLLYFARDAFIPVAIALFLTVLLSPAVDVLHRWKVPRPVAVLIVMLVVLLAFAGAVQAVWDPAREWLERAPQTLRKIEQRVRPLRAMFAQVDDVTERAGRITQADTTKRPAPTVVSAAPETGTALSMTASLIEVLTVIPLTLFLLLGGPPLLARMGASLAGNASSTRALRLTEAIGAEVGRYFATIALINIGLGVATGVAVAVLGMPNPMLWGALAGVLNFIPYVGPIVTITILTGAALVTFSDLASALAIPGSFIALHLVEGQIVQPLTVGRRLSVNALVVLLAVWFGFWYWGVAGVLLAVPSLVVLKVVAEHEPSWQLVRNFLAPNDPWQPTASQRRRKSGGSSPPP